MSDILAVARRGIFQGGIKTKTMRGIHEEKGRERRYAKARKVRRRLVECNLRLRERIGELGLMRTMETQIAGLHK